MHVKIQKWGNSLALRIPKSAAIQTRITNGSEVDISVVQGKLVAVPLQEKKYSLQELLSYVTKKNLHGEVDTSGAVGKEVW